MVVRDCTLHWSSVCTAVQGAKGVAERRGGRRAEGVPETLGHAASDIHQAPHPQFLAEGHDPSGLHATTAEDGICPSVYVGDAHLGH